MRMIAGIWEGAVSQRGLILMDIVNGKLYPPWGGPSGHGWDRRRSEIVKDLRYSKELFVKRRL